MPDRPVRDGRHFEPEPKPFGKVVITRNPTRHEITGHDRLERDRYTGKMMATLTALSPLHVGSGIYELAYDEPVRGLITDDGQAIVPGTSLKGAIRAIAEAISDSCLRIVREEIKRNLALKEAHPCNELKSSNREKGRELKLCVCCSIFGALGYQGRVSFTDARLVTGGTAVHAIPSPYPPRDSARLYKDTERRFNGRKFYYHGEPVAVPRGEPYQVITKDSQMKFSMMFENLTAAEFCLLLVAMGILDDIIIKVGGGKQAMLGSVEIAPTYLELLNPQHSFIDFSEQETESREVIQEGIIPRLLDEVGKANHLINEDALDELIQIWQWPSKRKAPTTMY